MPKHKTVGRLRERRIVTGSSNLPASDRFAGLASGLLRGGELRLRAASDCLRRYVGCFWIIEAGAHCEIRTIPDLCATLSVDLTGDHPPRVRLARPSTHSRTHRLRAGALIVGVRLRPAVISLLADPSTSMLERVGRELSAEFLRSGPCCLDPYKWIDALDATLSARLRGHELDPLIVRALDEAAVCAGMLRVVALSQAVGMSPRHLRRVFRCWVGLSPKQALRILRFQSTLRQFALRSDRTAATAASAGYFDQSHLARESARLAQATPGRLSKRHVADFSKTICGRGSIVAE